jgi:hypothetical protein
MCKEKSFAGLAFPPLYFYNGGVKEFLATIKQHVFLVRLVYMCCFYYFSFSVTYDYLAVSCYAWKFFSRIKSSKQSVPKILVGDAIYEEVSSFFCEAFKN